jgi:hypothetical protein
VTSATPPADTPASSAGQPAPTAEGAESGGADNDNVQEGDQNGPDTADEANDPKDANEANDPKDANEANDGNEANEKPGTETPDDGKAQTGTQGQSVPAPRV